MRHRFGTATRWRHRPERVRPQLLNVPNRAKVEKILHACSHTGRLPIVAIELERLHTLANGECIMLVVFVRHRERGKLPFAGQHIMRGDKVDEAAIERGAAQLGAALAQWLGTSVENDAADMLRESA